MKIFLVLVVRLPMLVLKVSCIAEDTDVINSVTVVDIEACGMSSKG